MSVMVTLHGTGYYHVSMETINRSCVIKATSFDSAYMDLKYLFDIDFF